MNYLKIFSSTALTIFAFMFDRIYDVQQPLQAQFVRNGDFAGVVWSILTLFIFAFYCKSWNKQKEIKGIEVIFSIIFSVFMLLGRTFSTYNNMDMLSSQKIMTIFAGLGWFIFFYMLLKWLIYFVEHQRLTTEKSEDQRHFQKIVILLILICWLPHIILSFPGNVPHDAMYQLCQWVGYDSPSDSHPWFTTVIFGLLFDVGRSFSDNTGVFIIIISQFLFCSWAYSRVCLTVDKYAGRKPAYFTALFFAVVPMWGSYAASVIKDTVFFAVFALYFCSFINIYENEKTSAKDWLVFWLLNLLICLIRQDGIYRIILSGIVLLLVLRKKRKEILLSLVGVCAFIFIYHTLIFDVLGVSKTPDREMLSIPFQQTARYIRDRGRHVSKEEKEIISKIFSYDKLPKVYDGNSSDPVKWQAKPVNKEDLLKYFKVWAEMGIRHPGVYFQASINNTYGYYYPFQVYRRMAAYQTYIKGKPVNKGLDIYYLMDQNIREKLINYDELWRIIPGISLLLNPGTYTWIALIGLMLILKKRQYRQLAVFSVLIVQILVCIASPVNGLLRYAMPLMASTPPFLAWLAHTLCCAKGDRAQR